MRVVNAEISLIRKSDEIYSVSETGTHKWNIACSFGSLISFLMLAQMTSTSFFS